ncbi:MAG: Fe-S cluster assembly protein SufD [Bacteroidota bacterium]|nr:Fe-S cluster assembly protein SufD [Bacteroidota bacterium]
MANEFIEILTKHFDSNKDYFIKKFSDEEYNFRRKAFESFINQDLPTRKTEDWKYTPLNFLYKNNFIPVIEPEKVDLPENIIQKINEISLKNNLLVYINGKISKEYSQMKSNDLKITSDFTLEIPKSDKYFEFQELDKFSKEFIHNPFADLSRALSIDSCLINVDSNIIIKNPLYLLNIFNTDSQSTVFNNSNYFCLGKNSELKIIESNICSGSNPCFVNKVNNIFAGDGSNIEYYQIQNDAENMYQINELNIYHKNNSNSRTFSISTSGKFTRNNLNVILDGEGSSAEMNGFYITDSDRFADNHTLALHNKPNCTSNEFYKGILDGHSTAVFNGKILVAYNAQKTNAYQTNKNILLSDEATINSKPQLEINADDVKCSHGATSGYLNEEALFYFRSRGIDEKTAQAILLGAFANEISNRITIDWLKEEISDMVNNKLKIDNRTANV